MALEKTKTQDGIRIEDTATKQAITIPFADLDSQIAGAKELAVDVDALRARVIEAASGDDVDAIGRTTFELINALTARVRR